MQDPIKKKERWKRWYARHGKAYNHKYYNENKEKLRESWHKNYLKGGLKKKLHDFKNRDKATNDSDLTLENLLKKFGEKPTCYLTGQLIDLNSLPSYALDHILPISRGGKSTLDNCGLATRTANQAKHNLTPQEFKELCQLVIARDT